MDIQSSLKSNIASYVDHYPVLTGKILVYHQKQSDSDRIEQIVQNKTTKPIKLVETRQSNRRDTQYVSELR